MNGKQFIENALSGFEIRPKTRAMQGAAVSIDRGKLQENDASNGGEYQWESFGAFAARAFAGEQEQRFFLSRNLAKSATQRNATLTAFGFTSEELNQIDLSASLADDFLVAPQIEQD